MSSRSAQVEVRNYGPADLAACRSLWVELTEWHRQIYGSPEIGGADPGRRFDEHLELVGGDRIWLATIGGEVVGMVGMIQTKDEIELEPIVVSERWRGRGIGRQLAEHVVGEARAAGMRQSARAAGGAERGGDSLLLRPRLRCTRPGRTCARLPTLGRSALATGSDDRRPGSTGLATQAEVPAATRPPPPAPGQRFRAVGEDDSG